MKLSSRLLSLLRRMRLTILALAAGAANVAGAADYRGEHVVVHSAGISAVQAKAIGRTVEIARGLCEEKYGFDMPGEIRVNVHVTAEEPRRLFNDGSDTFSLTIKDSSDLASPQTSGAFHLYGLCHETAHLAMYRLIAEHRWLTTDGAEGWAHYLGSVLVDEVYGAEGESLWPEPYDYRQDGTARLKRQLASASANKTAKAAGQWERLVEIVGPRGVAPIFKAWGEVDLPVGDPEPILRRKLLEVNSDPQLAAWWQAAAGQLLIRTKHSAFATKTAQREELTGEPLALVHDDGESAGKRSIAGSGHAVRFESPGEGQYLSAVKVFGARYGAARSEDRFHIWLCDEQFQVISDFTFPTTRFAAGRAEWVELAIPPTKVPRKFIVCAGFNPTATKGVFVHFDAEASGQSAQSVPGRTLTPFEQGDWMIRAEIDQLKSTSVLESLLVPIDSLYVVNLMLAAVAVGAIGLFAARLLRQQLVLEHALLYAAVALMLLCPIALAIANRMQLGAVAVNVGSGEPESDTGELLPGAVAAGVANEPNAETGPETAAAVPRLGTVGDDQVRSLWSPLTMSGLVRWWIILWALGSAFVLVQWIRGMMTLHRLRRSLEVYEDVRLRAIAHGRWWPRGCAVTSRCTRRRWPPARWRWRLATGHCVARGVGRGARRRGTRLCAGARGLRTWRGATAWRPSGNSWRQPCFGGIRLCMRSIGGCKWCENACATTGPLGFAALRTAWRWRWCGLPSGAWRRARSLRMWRCCSLERAWPRV